MLGTRIVSVGSYVPPRVVKNDDLSALMETSDEWIRTRTGIEQRHWVEPTGVATSDLALAASERALKAAGWKASELDMIILATLSPDHDFPGTACFLQAKLGVPGIPALDVRQQCSGFLYGLSIADQFLKTGFAKRILLVGAEIHSKGLDQSTRGRDVAVLFGDGAGAVTLEAVDVRDAQRDAHVLSTHIYADGTQAKELWVPAPGMAIDGERIGPAQLANGDVYPKMNGKTVFVNAVRRMPEAILAALGANRLSISDIDLFVFHQANLRINEAVGKSLGIPDEKIFNTIQKYANTTAATIPLGLDEAVRAGRLKPGMTVAMAAFGSGFTWASAIVRW